ncbi:hypothetical protein AVDCRST_MAG82-1118 [uncultured Rubrobacteraceae bacterium]|uniref:Uncharacterized protein n=1 Tax=uncultured Rubrobacteraceae bacterium TaxID=349277 RepID=A0A6J4PHD1_9ACTN|nr:hypothetical protein AVDCRST_MAG82-1118 [uncultured Rubrobacteraceae bacterium]
MSARSGWRPCLSATLRTFGPRFQHRVSRLAGFLVSLVAERAILSGSMPLRIALVQCGSGVGTFGER